MKTLRQRFMEKISKNPETGCWEWTACVHEFGYGRIGVERQDGSHTMDVAHRVSWKLYHGAIPEGQCVLHRCDNPRCANPHHLFLGTKADNIADMVAKGRQARGTKKKTKLTEQAVRAIRDRVAGGEPCFRLADEFHISRASVTLIVQGKRWGHVA